MFAAVKRKTYEAVLNLSEKILSIVSGILEYNCCKLETILANLIGKYMRRELLTVWSKTRFFFFQQSLEIQVKKEQNYWDCIMDQSGSNLLGKGFFYLFMERKRSVFTYSAMKMGIPHLCLLHFHHCLLKGFKRQSRQICLYYKSLVVTYFLLKLILCLSTFLSLTTNHALRHLSFKVYSNNESQL